MPTNEINKQILKQEFIKAATPNHLRLSLSLTEQCNFRCTYCFESFEIGRMSDSIYSSLLKFIDNTLPKLKTFELAWYGGEPLLEWERMVDFSNYCQKICIEHGVQMSDSSVPTNAWHLTTKVLKNLVNARISQFMISLDGTEVDHNKTRHLVSGKGTFNRIYENLKSAASTDIPFKILLRLHIHADNVASQLALVDILKADFSEDFRFSILPITVGDFGGANISKVNLHYADSKQLEAEISQRFRSNVIEKVKPEIYVCYAAKPNNIFIRPNGQLAKCTSALGRSDNIVGQLLENGELALNEEKILAWSFGFQTGHAKDLACPFHSKTLSV